MTDHPVFDTFTTVSSQSSGRHVYDFIGSATRVAYRKAWSTHAARAGQTVSPNLPSKNEHYFDWIALLRSVDRSRGAFRMAELGAGWAPWLVRAALAARQRPAITSVELAAVEADPTHYTWIFEHFRDNGLDPAEHDIVHGAAAGTSGVLRFPAIENPDVDYGAGLAAAAHAPSTIEVRAYTLRELLTMFSGPLDFLHVDIQGAEYEALPPAMDNLLAAVKSIMIGTHMSDDRHDGLVELFRRAGWTELFSLGRKRTHQTPWGEIPIYDGFLLYDNPRLV